MAWPTVNSNVNIAGVTTIKWGTGGAYAPAGAAIVISADEAQDVEKLYVEQGDGLRATRMLLSHGWTWDFTVIDDSSAFATGPNVNDQVTVVHFLGTGANHTFKGTIIDNNYRAARKQEGHRVMRIEIMKLIDTTSV